MTKVIPIQFTKTVENCITFGMRTQYSNKLIDNGTFGFGYNAKTWFGLDDKIRFG